MRRGFSSSVQQRSRKPSLPKLQALMSSCSSCCQCSHLSSEHHVAGAWPPSCGLLKSSSEITAGCSPSTGNTCGLRLTAERSSLSAQSASNSQPSSPIRFPRTDSSRSLLRLSLGAKIRQPTTVASQRSRKSSSNSKPLSQAVAKASKPSSPTAQPSSRSRCNSGGCSHVFGSNAFSIASRPSPPKLLFSRRSRSSTPRATHLPMSPAWSSPSPESARSNCLGAGALAN
mmetsp:Transcript_31737/g.62365  ORF Transcript_31737/g.62365 Transcript_31737/m.62365 type:complete len:229 (-) Transcript_31737:1030-1716(-)